VSDRSVGRRSAGRPVGDRPPHYSKATGDAEADASASLAETRHPSTFRRPTHLARRVANHDRRRGPPYRRAGGATHTAHTTDDDSRYRFAVHPTTRGQNNPAAAGHSRRARRSPGRSPGTTDFASRPGFPHDLGWGPLRNGRERRTGGGSVAGPSPLSSTRRRVATDHRFAGARARARHRPPGPGPRLRRAAVAQPSGARSQNFTFRKSPRTAVGRTPGPQRSRPCDRPRRRPANPADRRSEARGPRGRSRTAVGARRRRAVAGSPAARACRKTEIPG